jgi:hypothetical protein
LVIKQGAKMIGFIMRAACVALALSATALADPAETLAKAREASGGAAWDTVAGYVAKGSGSVAGYDVDVDETVDLKTGAFVRNFAALLGTGAEGFDGTTAWGRNPINGFQTSTDPAKNGNQRYRAYMFRRGYFKGDLPELKDLGPVNWDGKDLIGVQIVFEGQTPTELWFNTADMLLDRVIRRGEKVFEARFWDYRDVGGVKLPCSRKSFADGEGGDFFDCKSIEALPAIDPATFAPQE